MSFQSASILQQSDAVSDAAAASSGPLGGGGGGAGIQVVQLDAASSSVTETLPTPSEGASVIVVRTDNNDKKTAEIKDPNNSSIIWTGRQNEPKFEVYPQQSILLVADGSSWYVENAPVYSVSSRFRGIPKQDDLVFSRIMRHDFRVQSVILQVDEPPSQNVDFEVLTDGSFEATIQLSSGSSRLKTLLTSFPVKRGESLQLECRTDTVDVRNVEASFDLIRA